jgi:hypothetical protein
MRFVNPTIRPALLHTALWVGFALYEQSIRVFMSGMPFAFSLVLLNYLLNALFFYANSSLMLPRLYARQRYGAYAGTMLLWLALYSLLRTVLNLQLIPVLDPAQLTNLKPISFSHLLAASSYRGSFFLFVSIGYWFARHAIALEAQKRAQEHQLRLAERNLLEADLAFLKNQINPHFLFNTLNFFYAQVYPLSVPAAKGLLLLSDTMRYALHEDYQGKVLLTQEVQHVQNYIALNQLRFHNQLQVQFEVEGTLHLALVLPLVLITFVENCFKHGELGEAADPVVIDLVVARNQLTFRTRNKKRLGPKEKSSGVGLTNTRQRLALTYPGRHALVVEDGPRHYTCTLTLDL